MKTGATFFVGAVVASGTWLLSPVVYAHWNLGTETTVVLATGLLAAIVAVGTLYSQRAITRRQSTLEHLARLQADGDLIKGRVTFRKLCAEEDAMAALAQPGKENTAEYQAVATHLNEFELISIGIQRGIIDFELYKLWYKSRTIQSYHDAEPFILGLRKRSNNPMIFHEFEQMVRWFEKGSRPTRSRWWGLFF